MAFNTVASVLVCAFAIASLHNGLVSCNLVKRSVGAQNAAASATTAASPTAAECVVDPGLARRTYLLENAANTWAATLPPMLDILQEISDTMKRETPLPPNEPAGMDCTTLYQQGHNTSGIYKIMHHHQSIGAHKSSYAHCDMETDGGGWTVFQRRFDGSTDFYRGWDDYLHGFGHLDGEYWMGLERLHELTSLAKYELRIDLEAFDGSQAYAKYDFFRIGDSIDDYYLDLGDYSGTAGDGLTAHGNKRFSTKDNDNDLYSNQNCAETWTGAWWYYDCHISNLNGQYLGASQFDSKGMVWQRWKESENLKRSEMKIRRKA